MFQGYLTHAGIEIFNSARTSSYVANMAPGLSMKACWDDEGLGGVLGHGEYRTPVLDGAPWFSESRPASGKFMGFYPLQVEGIEDSSRSMNVTELVEDGAIFSAARRTSKEFRVRGLMMATDGEGLDAGMRWLRGALEAKDCTRCASESSIGDCAGHEGSYLAYLPTYCDYSKFPARPVNWNYGKAGKGSWAPYGSGRVSLVASGVRVIMPCEGDGAQFYATGLIPGETYRLRLAMRSPREMTVSVSGREAITAKRRNASGTLIRTPWVIDFVAQGETEAIKVFQAEAGCHSSSAYITDLRVDRIAELSKVFEPRFSWTDFAEPQSWEWYFTGTPTLPDTQILTAYDNEVERLYFGMENNGGSTITVGSGSGAQRIIRGLRPGARYTVFVNAGVTGGASVRPSIVGVTGSTYEALGDNWYSLTFRAERPAHYLRLRTSSSFTIPGTSLASIEVNYLRIDLNVSSMRVTDPDQASPARRELHGVELLNGPNVLHSYRTDAPAVMTEVEFTMSVARPYIYSEVTPIPVTPRATTTLVSNGECVNGEAVRVNYFTNPWFTNDSPMGGIATYQMPDLGNATVSAGGDKITVTPTGSTNFSYVQYRVNSSALKAGHIYTMTANIILDAPLTGPLFTNSRRIKVVDGITGLETGYQSAQAPNVAGRHRLSVRFVHTGRDMWIRFYHGGDNTNGPVHFNSFLFEEGGASLDTFSGYTNQNTRWLGTPNESPSEYRKLDPIAIRDPDCSPIPVAPQPPSIAPDCERDVEQWRRYWIEVPSERAGGWAESVPVVKLTTGDEAVRDVRIRFYPNDLGDDVSALDPCSYCGEFFISYVPANAVFTIDAIEKTAIADVRDRGLARAMHLVSDVNHGPIQWPQMSCDIPYYVTIDIAPDEVLDLNIDLAVALRE